METLNDLKKLLDDLEEIEILATSSDVNSPIKALMEAAQSVGLAFSGSWLGYHSRVYYEHFIKPPPGAHFSQEWGLGGESWLGLGSKGAWQEYDYDEVKREVLERAGNPNLENLRSVEKHARKVVQKSKDTLDSILANELYKQKDEFLLRCQRELESYSLRTQEEILLALSPAGQIMTRDAVALGQRTQAPPHVSVQLDALSALQTFGTCKEVTGLTEKVIAHLKRKNPKSLGSKGDRVFIGHGRDSTWRELKDYLHDRLKLPWDEFNRVPVAGKSTVERLNEMLNNANFAFLVLTAEDEKADGEWQARSNVVHEAGLFQGRLGFNRAIILLEEGCAEFSNIHGLSQIRFKKNMLGAKFDEIRGVLEREGVLN